MDLKSFGQAIRELAEEKGVDEAKVVETIELAVAAAYKKDYGKKGQIIRAKFNPETGGLRFVQVKIIVDETVIKSEEEIEAEETTRSEALEIPRDRVLRREGDEAIENFRRAGAEEEVKKVRFNPERHIMSEEAQKIKKEAVVGEELEFPLEPRSDFGRIASQTAKQVIIQRIREAEREATYEEYKLKEGQVISGIVQRIEGRNIFIDLGRGIGVLPPEEQISRERYTTGERVKALLILVEKDARGPGIFLSRAHPTFVKKLFELEVPEIPAGSVEIKGVAREQGSRTKIAVVSNDAAIDPVGSMVGQRGVRVSTVINELGGEKIDIIEWAEDPAHFIAHALSPAKVSDVALDQERHEARVIVPDDQLSLAIGRGGQNVRLAAKLTGWRIDVRSPSGPTTAEERGASIQEIPEATVSPEVVTSGVGDGSREEGSPGQEKEPEIKTVPEKKPAKKKKLSKAVTPVRTGASPSLARLRDRPMGALTPIGLSP